MIEQVMDLRDPQTTEMTTADRAEFLRYDKVADRGMATFVEVGNALSKIRDGKLYRHQYASFEEYCDLRHGLKRQRAYELMAAATVAENLSEISDKSRLRESHVDPLTKLSPDEQREAYTIAVVDAQGKVPTAAQVTKAAAEFAPRREPRASRVERIHKPTPIPAPEPAAPTYIMPVVEMEPEPAATMLLEIPAIVPTDPRLGQAQTLRTMLVDVRDLARADYGDLTGRHTDLLVWERDTETLIERLDSLIEILSDGV